MKFIQISCLILLFGISALHPAYTQTEIEKNQNEWINALKSGQSLADYSWVKGYFLFADIKVKSPENVSQFLQKEVIKDILGYSHQQNFRHDNQRYISVGEIQTKTGNLVLLTGWRLEENSWKKEIDVILSQKSEEDKMTSRDSLLNTERKKWVQLANQHNPKTHVEQSYTSDALYFGNGQLSEGHDGVAERYFYMENANYQVDLEKEQLWNISEDRVLEVGRYFTGAERTGTGGLYVILWQKQESGAWKIKLDYNF